MAPSADNAPAPPVSFSFCTTAKLSSMSRSCPSCPWIPSLPPSVSAALSTSGGSELTSNWPPPASLWSARPPAASSSIDLMSTKASASASGCWPVRSSKVLCAARRIWSGSLGSVVGPPKAFAAPPAPPAPTPWLRPTAPAAVTAVMSRSSMRASRSLGASNPFCAKNSARAAWTRWTGISGGSSPPSNTVSRFLPEVLLTALENLLPTPPSSTICLSREIFSFSVTPSASGLSIMNWSSSAFESSSGRTDCANESSLMPARLSRLSLSSASTSNS